MPFGQDSIDSSSGLLGHFEGEVIDSFWSTPQAESEGKATGDYAIKPRLYWHVKVLDVLQENYKSEVPETITMAMTIGDGWQMVDENTIIHDNDKDDNLVKFKNSSAYGMFVNICVGGQNEYKGYKVLDGDGDDVEVDLSEVLSFMESQDQDWADPRNPQIWKGFAFEFRGMGRVFRSRPGEPAQDPRSNPVPVKVLYTPGGGEAGGSAESSQPSDSPASGSDALAQEFLGAGADRSTATALAKLIGSARTHTSFVKNASTLPGVKDNDALMSLIEDEANGPWSRK